MFGCISKNYYDYKEFWWFVHIFKLSEDHVMASCIVAWSTNLKFFDGSVYLF